LLDKRWHPLAQSRMPPSSLFVLFLTLCLVRVNIALPNAHPLHARYGGASDSASPAPTAPPVVAERDSADTPFGITSSSATQAAHDATASHHSTETATTPHSTIQHSAKKPTTSSIHKPHTVNPSHSLITHSIIINPSTAIPLNLTHGPPAKSNSHPMAIASVFLEALGGLAGAIILLASIRCFWVYKRTPRNRPPTPEIDEVERTLALLRPPAPRVERLPPPPYQPAPEYDQVVREGEGSCPPSSASTPPSPLPPEHPPDLVQINP